MYANKTQQLNSYEHTKHVTMLDFSNHWGFASLSVQHVLSIMLSPFRVVDVQLLLTAVVFVRRSDRSQVDDGERQQEEQHTAQWHSHLDPERPDGSARAVGIFTSAVAFITTGPRSSIRQQALVRCHDTIVLCHLRRCHGSLSTAHQLQNTSNVETTKLQIIMLPFPSVSAAPHVVSSTTRWYGMV